jgi:HlyD family secretion protein
MKLLLRRIVWLVVGLGVVGVVALAFRPTPLAVDVARVERGVLRVTVDTEAKTRLRDRFVVSAPVAGRLARITLEAGDTVEQGAVVARLDPLPLDAAVREAQARLAEWQAQREGVATLRPKPEALAQGQARVRAAEAAQREAEAMVDKAQAALEQARRDLQRAQRLEAVGAIAREARESAALTETTRAKEFEAAQLEAQRATAEVRAAQAALAVLEAQRRDPDYLLDVYSARMASVEAELARLRDAAVRTEIHAQVGGQVLRVLEEHERMVAAGTPLLELGNLSEIELVVDVLSTDAVKVQPGATVLVEHWGGDRTLQARVRRVEPAAYTKISALGVEEQRVNVIADFSQMPVPLGAGYRVEARIVVWEGAAVLKVPVSALFRCADAWCVFMVTGGKAQRQQVAIGQRSGLEAEVRHGLQASDVVLVHPTEQVADGKRIRPRR